MYIHLGFPGSPAGKESTCNAGDPGSIPGSGRSAGEGIGYPLQGIFPTQGSNHGLPHCGRILYQLSYRGSPRILEWVAYPFSSGSSWPRNQTGASCIAGGVFTNWAIREALSNGKTYTNLHDPRRTRRDFGHGDIIFFAEKHSVILSTETLCPFFLWKSPSWRVQALCKGSY